MAREPEVGSIPSQEEITRQLEEALASSMPMLPKEADEPVELAEGPSTPREEPAHMFPEVSPVMGSDVTRALAEHRRRFEQHQLNRGSSTEEARDAADEEYNRLLWVDPDERAKAFSILGIEVESIDPMEAYEAKGETWDTYANYLERAAFRGVRAIRGGGEPAPKQLPVWRRHYSTREITPAVESALRQKELQGGVRQIASDAFGSLFAGPGIADYKTRMASNGLLAEPGAHIVGDHPTVRWGLFVEPADVEHKAERVAAAGRGEVHPAQAFREYEAWRKAHRNTADDDGFIPPRDNELHRQYEALVHLVRNEDKVDDNAIYQAMANIPAYAIPDAVTRAALDAWDPERSPLLWQLDESKPFTLTTEFIESYPPAQMVIEGIATPFVDTDDTYFERVNKKITPWTSLASELVSMTGAVTKLVSRRSVDVSELAGVYAGLEQGFFRGEWHTFVELATSDPERFESEGDRQQQLLQAFRSVIKADLPPEMEGPGEFSLVDMLDVGATVPREQWSEAFASTYDHTYSRLVESSGATSREEVAAWLKRPGLTEDAAKLVDKLTAEFNKLEMLELPPEFLAIAYGDEATALDKATVAAQRYKRRYEKVKGDFPQRLQSAMMEVLETPEVKGDVIYQRESWPGYSMRMVGVLAEPVMEAFATGTDAVFAAGDAAGLWEFESPRYAHPGAKNYALRALDNLSYEGRPGVMLKTQDFLKAFGVRPGSDIYEAVMVAGMLGEFLPWETAQAAPLRVATRASRLRPLMAGATGMERWKAAAMPSTLWKKMDVRNPLTNEPVEYPGLEQMMGERAAQIFDENLAVGSPLEDVIGPRMRSQLREVIRVGGADPTEVIDAVKARGLEAANEYVDALNGVVEGVDEFTVQLRDTAEYKAIEAQVHRLNAAGLLEGGRKSRRLNRVEAIMRFVEQHALMAHRTRGMSGALDTLKEFMDGAGSIDWRNTSKLDPRGYLARPSGGRVADINGGTPLEQQIAAALAKTPANEINVARITAVIDGLVAEEAIAPIFNADGKTVQPLPDRSADSLHYSLADLSSEELAKLSLFGESDDLLRGAQEEIRFRVGMEHLDASTATRDAVTAFIAETIEPLLPLYTQTLDEAASIAERVRKLVEADGPTEAVEGAKLFGREQMLESLASLRDAGVVDEPGYLILAAWLDIMPDRVLAGLRLEELLVRAPAEVKDAAARFTGLTAAESAGRVRGSINFFAHNPTEPGLVRGLEPAAWRNASLDEVLASVGMDPTIAPLLDGAHAKSRRAAVLRVFEGTLSVDEAAHALLAWDAKVLRSQGKAAEAVARLEPDSFVALTAALERDLLAASTAMGRTGERVYYFLHELGHGVLHTFLSDAEVARLFDAFADEQMAHGLMRDTPYVRAQEAGSMDAFHEWFAENFAEYVINHQMPAKLSGRAIAPYLRHIFDALIERLSDFFQNWFQRKPRWEDEYHPMFKDVVDRLIDGKAEEISKAKEIYSRQMRGSKPMFVRGVSEALLEGGSPVQSFRIGITGATEKLHDVRPLLGYWREAYLDVARASNPEIRAERLAVFDRLDLRLQEAMRPALEQALFEGLPPDTIQIRNILPDVGLEQALGRFAAEPVEPGFYLDISGPRDIVVGRLAAASESLQQDGMLIRRIEEEVGPVVVQAKPVTAAVREALPDTVFVTRVDDYNKFEAAKQANTRTENLAPKELAEYGAANVFLAEDGAMGFMVKEGDLQNVFNNSGIRGAGREMLLSAVEQHGARTLDCYDGFLPEYYSKAGFVEVARLKFVDEYAPPGWDFDALGRPDVVIMAYQGGDPSRIRSRYGKFGYQETTNYLTDFDEAQELARRGVRDSGDPRGVDAATRGQARAGVGQEVRTGLLGEGEAPHPLIRVDEEGVTRSATLTIDLPAEFAVAAQRDLYGVIAELWVGATIRTGVSADGGQRLEIAHTREWSNQTANDFVRTMQLMRSKIDNITKKRKTGDVIYRWAHEEVLVAEAVARRVESEGVFYGHTHGYQELIRAGRDAEDALGGVGGGLSRDEGLRRGVEAAADRGPGALREGGAGGGRRDVGRGEPVAGRREPGGPDDSRVYGSLPLARRIAGKFLPQDEILGGTPHAIVDVDIETQLQGRVDRGEISEIMRDHLLERFGKATPLEAVEHELALALQVDGVGEVQYTAKVAPVTKDGHRVHLPGGLDGKWSFADVNYVARRPIELIDDDLVLPLPASVDDLLTERKGAFQNANGREPSPQEVRELTKELIHNYDEVMESYLDEYHGVVTEIYEKLYQSFGTEPYRPDPAKYFDKNDKLIPAKAQEWRELKEVELLDIARQFVFAMTSRQTNLLDNQIYAAIISVRSMDELRALVDRFQLWESRKGAPLSEGEARHLVGLAPTASESMMKKLFQGQGLVDVEKTLLPLIGDTIPLRNYDLPHGPIMEILPADILTANAQKILPRARKATTKLRRSREKLATARQRLKSRSEALERYEGQLASARTDKQKAAASKKIGNARTSIARYEEQIKKGKQEIRRDRRDLQRARVGVRVEATALTDAPVYTSPSPARELLEVYQHMLEDFEAVLRGDQQYSWFERLPSESWEDTLMRLSGSVPGLATKVTIFGLVWQNPAKATIGAVDIHIFRKYAPEMLYKHHYAKIVQWLEDWKAAKGADDKTAFKSQAEARVRQEQVAKKQKKLGRSLSASEIDDISLSTDAVNAEVTRIREKAIADRANYTLEQFMSNAEDNPARSYWTEKGQSLLLEPDKVKVMPLGSLATRKVFSDAQNNYKPRVDSSLMAEVVAKAQERVDTAVREVIAAEERVRRAGDDADAAASAQKKLMAANKEKATADNALASGQKGLEAHKQIESWRDLFGADSAEVKRLYAKVEGDATVAASKATVLHVMSEDYARILDEIRKEASERGIAPFLRQHIVWDTWRGYMDPHLIAYPGASMLPGMKAEGWKALWGSFKEAGYGGSPTFRSRPRPSSLAEAPAERLSAAFYARHPEDPRSGLHDLGDLNDAGRQIDDFFVSGNIEALFDRGEQILRSILVEDHSAAMAIMHKHFDTVTSGDGVTALSPQGRREAAAAFKAYWYRKVAPSAGLLFWFERMFAGLGELWRRLRSRSDLLPNEVKRTYDEAFRYWEAVDGEARYQVSISPGPRQARFPSVAVKTEETIKPPAGAGRELIRAGKGREVGAINMQHGRVRKALGLKTDSIDADPVEIYRNAIRYVMTENARNALGMSAVAITRNSYVPASQVDHIYERVQKRLELVHGPTEDFKLQIKRRPVLHPETGEQVFDPLTGRPQVDEVFVLDKDQQFFMRIHVNELALDPVSRPSTPRSLMDPRNDLLEISVQDYELLRNATIDAESGLAAGRSRYAERAPKSLGYAAVGALVSGMERIGLGGIIQRLRQDFVVPRALGKKLDPKTGRMVAAPDKVPAAGAHVVEAIEATMQRVFATDEWALQIVGEIKRGDKAAGMAELIDGLHRTVSPVLDPITLRRAHQFKKMFAADTPLRLADLKVWLPEIQAMFVQSKFGISDMERAALRDLSSVVNGWDGKRALTKLEKTLIESAHKHLNTGIATRLDAADQQLHHILIAFGGSRDKGLAQRIMMEPVEVHRQFYRAFYEGRWSDLIEMIERKGFVASGKKYNLEHAQLEAVLRLHALNAWGDLVEEMASSGLHIRVDELTRGLDRDVDAALFVERVKHYLNVMSNYGGLAILDDVTGKPLQMPPGFAPGKRVYGREVAAAEPGAALYPLSAQVKGEVLRGKTITGQRYAHDMKAYTAARKIFDEWGFKIGLGEWVEVTLPKVDSLGNASGERVIVPNMLANEIGRAVDRVAGQGLAYGERRPARWAQEAGEEFRVGEKVEGAIQAGVDAIVGSLAYNKIYSHLRMGVTGGIIMPNLPYYTGVAIGSYIQMFQKLGFRGLLTVFRHPRMAGELTSRMWGQGKELARPVVPALVTARGAIYTADMLERLTTMEGLNSSFVRSATARLFAEDIKNKAGGFWSAQIAAKGYRWWQSQLVEFSTAIDNYYRMSVLLDQLDQGHSATAAAATARSALFDYGALTDFEKKAMRNTFIFYSYMRKNLDLFFDTLLTNPHRITGQIRLIKGLTTENLEDPELVIPEYDLGRLPLLMKETLVNDHLNQKRVNWLPLLSITDVFQLSGDIANASSILPGGAPFSKEDFFGIVSRLNPLLGGIIATGTETQVLGGRPMRVEAVPEWYAQWDLALTGGMVLDFLDASYVPIPERIRADYPGQTDIWIARNKKAYWLWRNLFHVGPVGGRGVSILETFDRADAGIVEAMVGLTWRLHDLRVAAGIKEEIDEIPFFRGGGEMAAPRPGYSSWDEFMSAIGFRARTIESVETAEQRAIREHERSVRERSGEYR